MIDRAAERRQIGYHPKCQKIGLTHLCFADDLMVFVDGKKRSIEGVLSVFQEFEKCSGLRISLEKSTFFLGGIDDNTKAELASTLPLVMKSLPMTYLGLPLLSKRMSTSDYMPLIEKVRHRFSSWTGRFLSYAGRLQLISSIIMSLLNFWMSAYRLPNACIKKLEGLCSAFLWSGPELNHKKAKILWTDICKPKKEAGLGVKSLLEANKTSCLKLIWRLLSQKESLWVDWIWKHNIRTASFWTAKETASTGSWMWKKLLKYRELARRFHRVKVENGTDISFWFDNWSDLGRIMDITGDRGIIDMGLQRTATLQTALLSVRRRRHRSETLIRIDKELLKVRQHIQEFGDANGIDRHVWLHKHDKYKQKFTTKDTWNLVRHSLPAQPWPQGIWFSNSTPKYSFLAWMALRNRLPTSARIHSWNPSHDPLCKFCNTGEETTQHLFFSCVYSSNIWKSLMFGLLHNNFSSDWNAIISLISKQVLPRTPLFLLRYTFQATLHSIWRERNDRLHGKPPSPPERLSRLIDKTVRNRISSTQQSSNKLQDGLTIWFASRTS